MFEKLGPAKYVLPALVVVLMGCVMALMFYPIIHMSPKDLTFAVLSLDEGATTPQGAVNAGATLAQQLVNAPTPAGATSPIKWHLVQTQAELDKAIANNEYYGALTIPAGFTQAQALAQAGQGEPPRVAVVLDNAKSPLMATQLQASMGALFGQLGIGADVSVIHGAAAAPSASPLAGMMSQQLGVTPLIIMSLLGSILLFNIFPKKRAGSTEERFGVLGRQLAYAAVVSLLAGLTSVVLLNGLVGAGAPFWTTTVFLWFACFCVMALFLGAFNVALPVGGLAVLGVLSFGMMTSVLTAEVLPAFWANWIYPWVPQPAVAGGLRDILYMGAGLMPRGSGSLLILGVIGLALLAVAGIIPNRKRAA